VKLLFDENVSARLVGLLDAEYPSSAHIEQIIRRGCTDTEVWEYARANGFTIASKDNDFRQRAFLYGPPPKVVWLDVGNAGTDAIAALLRERSADLKRFGAATDTALLVINVP
jgi:predicted nuclease of predicted toxin-antitoxin system